MFLRMPLTSLTDILALFGFFGFSSITSGLYFMMRALSLRYKYILTFYKFYFPTSRTVEMYISMNRLL